MILMFLKYFYFTIVKIHNTTTIWVTMFGIFLARIWEKTCRSETLIQSDFFYRDSSASITSAMRSQPDSPSNSVVIEDEPEVIEDQNKGKSKVRKKFVKGCRI